MAGVEPNVGLRGLQLLKIRRTAHGLALLAIACPSLCWAQPVHFDPCHNDPICESAVWRNESGEFLAQQNSPKNRSTVVTGTVVGIGDLSLDSRGLANATAAIYISEQVVKPQDGLETGKIVYGTIYLLPDFWLSGTPAHPTVYTNSMRIKLSGKAPTGDQFKETFLGRDFLFAMPSNYFKPLGYLPDVAELPLLEKEWIKACAAMDRPTCEKGPYVGSR